ncbi:MAG: ABC transporter permease [Dehalococcoidia bacterium]
MIKFIIFRLFYMFLVIVFVSVLVFALSRMSGDPRDLYMDDYATPAQYEAWGREWGLDKPLYVQYLVWASKAVRGDFGRSIKHRQPALDVVRASFPATLQLASAGFLVTLAVAVPLGVLSAINRGSLADYAGRGIALFGQALPAFWIGIMLILVFAVQLGWLPTGTRGDWKHYILPAITLGTGPAAGLLRIVRSSMLNVLDSEYIKLARAKGVGRRTLIWKHAFRNALIAPLTFSGLILAGFITGSVVTETVFSWPGVGRLAVLAIFDNDFPLISAVVMSIAGLYVFISLMVDLTYALVDPRIRFN